MLKWGCAISGLMIGCLPVAALAQDAQQAQTTAQGKGQDQPQNEPGQQQQQPTPAAGAPAPVVDDLGEEIVVSGELPGAVKTDVKPEAQLGPADIRAYGANSVSELMTALSAQLGSGSGRGDEQPVILISGRRANMREVADIPTEAIERIDILPEEVALQYGYGATQKVINFVLRRRFQVLTGVLSGSMPTDGGNATGNGEINLFKLNPNGRLTVVGKYNRSSGLLESERGVTRAAPSLFDVRGNITGLTGGEIDPALSALAGTTVTVAGVPDSAANGSLPLSAYVAGANDPNVTNTSPYRTLVAPQSNLSLSTIYNVPVSNQVSATATLGYETTQSESLLGLASGTLRLPTGNPFSPFSQDVRLLRYYDTLDPLERDNSSRTLTAGLTMNGETTPWVESWRWSLQANYSNVGANTRTTTGIDTSAMQALLDADDPSFNPFTPVVEGQNAIRPDDWTKSNRSTATVDFLTNGSVFKLPAGDVRTSIRVQGQTEDNSSSSFRLGTYRSADLARDRGGVRGNINIPLTSRRRDVLSAIGDLSVNANIEVEQVSDFGSLTSTGYGLTWSPINPIQANITFINDRNAPSISNLGDPVLITPNVTSYDYVRNESVNITRITGGNPLLESDNRHVFRAGMTIRPLSKTNLIINANYTSSEWRNQIQSFPSASPELEAAFPDRFVRDASGQLLSIDARPVNIDRREQSQLRWGFNLQLPISSPAAKRMQARRAAFMKAREESRRTGQPMPAEMTAMMEQFRSLGQMSSLFGSPFQRGQGQGGQGQGGPGQGQGQGQTPAQQGQDQGREQAQQGQQGQPAPADGAAPPPPGGPGGPGGGGFGGPGGGGRGFGGPGGGRGFGGGGSRVILSAYHTWVLHDLTVIREGLPTIDRLSGIGSLATPEHKIEATAAIRRDALGFQLNGTWQSGTRTTTGLPGDITELNWGSLAKINLQMSFDPGADIDLLIKHHWLRGSRIMFNVDNLFNARQRVTDQNGITPTAQAPNLLDPMGRVVKLTFRKQLF